MKPITIVIGLLLTTACTSKDPAPAQPGAAPEVREGYAITPDSVRLYYRMVGNGPETVLIGAANYHKTSFDALATPGRRVVLFDSRGRGKTDSVPLEKTGIEQFDVSDLDVLRKEAGADAVSIIAWSGMATAAFRYAADNPDRVKALVLFAPVGPRWVPWWDDMRKNAAAKADTGAANALAARVKAGEFEDNEVALCRASAQLGLKTNWTVTERIDQAPDVCDSPNEVPSRYNVFVPRLLTMLGKYDYRADFGKVTARRLVIHGEFDNPPLEGSREWVAGQPEARLLVIKGVGHWPHYEKPEETLAALRAFLDGGWPVGSDVVSRSPATLSPPELPAPSTAAETIAIPPIQERTLENGFRLLVVEDRRAPRIAANLWIRVGSMAEPVGLHGITHFLEHALHQGSTTFGTRDLKAELPLLSRIHETEQRLIAAQRRERNRLRQRSVFYDELALPSTGEVDSLRAELYRLEDEDSRYREFWESYQEYMRQGGQSRHTDPVPASTEQEYMEIGMALPTNALELFFRVEADRLANAVLRGWEAQRFTVLEQILGARGRPQIRFNEAIDAVTGFSHPVFQPDGGHPRDFAFFTRAAMIDIYERYFVPNNVTLVLVGDISLGEASALAERYFGRLPRGPEPPADLDLEAEGFPSGAVRLDWTEPLSPQVHLRYRIPGIGHPDRPVLDVIAALLSGPLGMASGRLDQSVAAQADFRVIHTNRFGSTAGLNLVAHGTSDGDLAAIERGLLAAVDDLREGRLDQAALARAQKRLRLDWAKTSNRAAELAFVIGHHHTMNHWTTLAELLQARDAATVEQVVRVARTYLLPSNRVIAVARAAPAPGGGPIWLDSAWASLRTGGPSR